MPEEPYDWRQRHDEMMQELARLEARQQEQIEGLRAMNQQMQERRRPGSENQDETLRRQDETIARLDGLIADWDRMKAAGEIASLSDLTRWLHALEARISRLERRVDGLDA